MFMSSLTQAHIDLIGKWLKRFREFMQTDQGQEWYRDRRNRCKSYQEALSVNKIAYLTEDELSKILGDLWANELWTDKSKPLKRVLSATTLGEVKAELKNLLWDSKPLNIRYDEFRNNVKGIGPAATTELLALVHPEDCAIWNKRARNALKVLKIDDIVPIRYQINGDEYTQIVNILKQIKNLLVSANLPLTIRDLMDVDFFFSFIYSNIPSVVEPPILEEDYDFDHDEVKDALFELGGGLGFEAEAEVPIAKGARIDVLWKAKIANLGIVKYVFEVHRSGSIDGLILNLQRAKGDPSVQRLIAVSNTKNLRVMQEEVSPLPEEFRKSLAFMEARDALKASDLIKNLKEILDKLELVKSV